MSCKCFELGRNTNEKIQKEAKVSLVNIKK